MSGQPSNESNSANEAYDRELSSPSRRILAQKMKSTSAIIDRRGMGLTKKSSQEGDDKVFEFFQSFRHMKSHGINHFRTTDLDSISDRNLEDSHTSYRKCLEREITELKVKLAEAQEKADILQNDFNRVSIEKGVLQASMNGIIEKYDNTKRHCDELGAVVVHLQENAKESSSTKRLLEERVERGNKDYQTLQKKNKQLRHENRKLQRDLKLVGNDLEGRGMENQGLKSENDWLKKQLQEKLGRTFSAESNGISDLGESSDDEKVVTGIHELLSFPSASKRMLSTNTNIPRRKQDDILSEEGKRAIEEEVIVQGRMEDYVPFKDKPISIRVSSKSSHTPTQIEGSNSNINTIESSKTTSKWSWWSPFDVGASESNLNHVYEDDESKLSDSIVQNPEKVPDESHQHHILYAEPSAKRLVPKSFGDSQR